ncbi:MAG: type II toxin-antitoxin system HicA family toxin [Chloroflexi bacterium]|nr:type II toxin-antitoxin system HicA family toxin [Chloroflexota bacterium]
MSGREVVRALERLGFGFVSQEGSHVKLRKRTSERTYTVIVPLHPELARGTLASILRQAGLTLAQLQENL